MMGVSSMDKDIDYRGMSIGDLMKNSPEVKEAIEKKVESTPKAPATNEIPEITLEKVMVSPNEKRAEVVKILDRLLGDKENVIVSISKVVALSGMNRKTFQKYLNSIRDVEFTVINKGYGTEIRRR
jgi:predicted transcriptional regulator